MSVSAAVPADRSRLGARREWWTGGLSLSGALSLAAIVAVLVVVSVPRLRRLAVQENEADARVTAQVLARALADCGRGAARLPSLAELLRRPELAGTLADAELLAKGTLLRRHGYLFEITRLASPHFVPGAVLAFLRGEAEALQGLPAIRAWPWAHGETGETAFLVTCSGASLAHANSPPQWQGPECAGRPLDDPTGWRPRP